MATPAWKLARLFCLISMEASSRMISEMPHFTTEVRTVLNDIRLAPGQQLTYPVNVSGNWNARSFVTYGLPLKWLKSNLNINTGFHYNRNPALIDDAINLAHNYTVSQGLILSSNISE